MSILPQSPVSPLGITVSELIAYGRFPHKKGFGKLNDEDKKVIDWALKATNMDMFKDSSIDELSGGQRQRV